MQSWPISKMRVFTHPPLTWKQPLWQTPQGALPHRGHRSSFTHSHTHMHTHTLTQCVNPCGQTVVLAEVWILTQPLRQNKTIFVFMKSNRIRLQQIVEVTTHTRLYSVCLHCVCAANHCKAESPLRQQEVPAAAPVFILLSMRDTSPLK